MCLMVLARLRPSLLLRGSGGGGDADDANDNADADDDDADADGVNYKGGDDDLCN